MKKNIIMFAFILVSLKLNVKAQYVIKEADQQFELYNYKRAIDLYEQAWKRKESKYVAARLAFCYKMQQDYQQTESWAALAASHPDHTPEDILNYAQALQESGKYTEAKAQYIKYKTLDQNKNEVLVNRWIVSCDSALQWMKDANPMEILNEKALNSSQSEWGAVKIGKDLFFASNRPSVTGMGEKMPFLKFDAAKLPDNKLDGFSGAQYFKLFIKKDSDSLRDFKLSKELKYHVGPASFTADCKHMFFTTAILPGKDGYQKVKKVGGKLATATTGIYYALKDADGNWGEPKAFKYNSNAYSNGDPFISNDGKRLYFCSNMPGGKGGTDVYVSIKGDSGEWGPPTNLKEINTAGNERSPLFDLANNFYFSSDGYVGMGGLDVYVSIVKKGQISQPINVGYPLNSPQDDFALVFDTDNSGYFTSNRHGGVGHDDIYRFTKQENSAYKLKGIVFEKGTGLPIADALVTLKKQGGSQIQFQTDGAGRFKFNLDRDASYQIAGTKTGFRNDLSELNTNGLTIAAVEFEKNLYLERVIINKPIKIDNIYYDFDRADIRPDAAKELDKLVKIMQDNPTIWIELGSHTDSRGNDKYNLKLSQKRADSVIQYLIKNGIEKNRVIAVGYGETTLLNACANGVECTEEQHQLNRRTEFKIIKQ